MDSRSLPQILVVFAVGAIIAAMSVDSCASDEPVIEMDNKEIVRLLIPDPVPTNSQPTSESDTIYVGYSPSSNDPNGVGIGGIGDFDTDVAGTDSSQFWKFFLLDWRSESTTALPTPESRPIWYFNHGNEVNIGDTNLWASREQAGRVYRRTGVIGVWHRDTMSGIGSGSNSLPLAGAASAWCGLRQAGDDLVRDEITSNPLNGGLARQWTFGGALIPTTWPGYGNQWDQILYRDVIVSGGGGEELSFRFATEMSDKSATDNGGSAWFNPDPTDMANFQLNPIDSLMVWVGLPKETGVYDINRRWLSEVLDFDAAGLGQPAKIFSQHGTAPLVGTDSTVTVSLPALDGSATVRIAFQIKTNRQVSDETYDLEGYNSVRGAALIDDITLDAAVIGDFESVDAIRPRALINPDGTLSEIDPATAWITTGKPPQAYPHVESVYDLPYEDPCGALGSPDRTCNLDNNIVVLSNHDDPEHAHFRESAMMAESPTIDLSPGSPLTSAGVGTTHNLMRLEFEMWTGVMDLDQSVFYNYGARYFAPALLQQADPQTPAWSWNTMWPCISFSPDPTCAVFNSNTDLDGLVPPPSEIDSMKIFCFVQTRCSRFGATVLCGKSEGTYFDNVRVGFTTGETSAIKIGFWDLYQDTFPFNGTIAPGSADFDTTTALIKTALNNASSSGGEGVIIADTLSLFSPFGTDTRLDMVFRIRPGPGNYTEAGNTASPLIEKDGNYPFWATYLANNGPVGSPSGHPGGVWSADVWNSARMDSADNGNLSPLVSRRLGVPATDIWEATLHEEDPDYSVLGISRRICFLVDPSGSVNSFNVCCSLPQCGSPPFLETYPPSAYAAGTPTATTEGTKILPDGYFSPGTNIEYFLRRSDASNPSTNVFLAPDTNRVAFQPDIGGHADGQRYLEIAILPDLWKDQAYGGSGLACMLVVDAGDRRGQEMAILGALDSLGYGKNNGAARGWKEVNPASPDPDDPAGFIPGNLGQKGLAFDWYDINAAESAEGGRPGCRLAVHPPELADRQCKQGPTPDMLKTYYNTILWVSDDLNSGVLHDGLTSQEQSDDVGLIKDFLDTSSGSAPRAVWIAGDGAAEDLSSSLGDAPALLSVYFAVNLVGPSYFVSSNNRNGTAFYDPVGAPFHPSRQYGIRNQCVSYTSSGGSKDVIEINQVVPGGLEASRYEDTGHRPDPSINPGVYTASVYRPADDVSRFYSTLLSGHDLSSLRGSGGGNSLTDAGRIAFIEDALRAFDLCVALGPVVQVGDIPGVNGARLNFVRGAVPNPAMNGNTAVEFHLAQPAKVTLRIYNVAGRLVHETRLDGVEGANRFLWDGGSSSGTRVVPGVYFYRLTAPGVEFDNNRQKMVMLGG